MEELDNGKGLIAADKFYQVPKRQGVFACGDIIRPHLLTTVIGQGSIAADSIDRYLGNKEMAKRPKVDVHHFNLLDKLREVNLEPKPFKPVEERDLREIDRGLRGTSLAGKGVGGFAIHNYEDRSAAEVCQSSELFLAHFPQQERIKRTEIGPSAEEVLGHFAERMVGLTDKQAVDESKRCMSCGMCFECDNCVIYCPQTAVKRTPKCGGDHGPLRLHRLRSVHRLPHLCGRLPHRLHQDGHGRSLSKGDAGDDANRSRGLAAMLAVAGFADTGDNRTGRVAMPTIKIETGGACVAADRGDASRPHEDAAPPARRHRATRDCASPASA